MTTTAAPPMAMRPAAAYHGGRTKRELGGLDANSDTILKGLLPALTAVAHARDGLIPVNCTYRHICQANKFLVETMGNLGRSVGSLLSSEIGKLLIEVDRKRGPVVLKSINKVAQLGRSEQNCDELFRDCETLFYLPTYSMPPSSRFIKITNPSEKKNGADGKFTKNDTTTRQSQGPLGRSNSTLHLIRIN